MRFEMKRDVFGFDREASEKKKNERTPFASVMSVKMRKEWKMGWRERGEGEGNSVNFGGCPPQLEALFCGAKPSRRQVYFKQVNPMSQLANKTSQIPPLIYE